MNIFNLNINKFLNITKYKSILSYEQNNFILLFEYKIILKLKTYYKLSYELPLKAPFFFILHQ